MPSTDEAFTVLRIQDKAEELYRQERPSTYHSFVNILKKVYNELDPDNDYDLDIG